MATEGEAVTEQQPAAEEPEKVVAEKAAKAAKEKKPKTPKEKKPKQSKTLSHPPYFQMITEALTALQEKSGSSPYAIAKYMEEKHKDELPANFRKILAVQLKHFAAKGNLIKIRASYKLSGAVAAAGGKTKKEIKTNAKAPRKTRSVTAAAKIKAESAAAAAAPPPPKKAKRSAAAKPKQPKSIKSPAAKKAKKATAQS